MGTGFSDTTAILIVVILIIAFFALWSFNGRQKRKFEDAQRARKREIERLKAKAAEKNSAP